MTDYGYHEARLDNFQLAFYWGSETGALHQAEGKGNEDAIFYTSTTHYFAMAVADGLGSCKYSAEGAQKAVTTFCRYVDSFFLETNTELQPTHIWNFIEGWRDRYGEKAKLYDTTFQWIVCTGETLYSGSIGDGMICSKGESFYLYPRKEQPFGNITVSLASCTERDMQFNKQPLKAMTILACTDGIANDLIEDELPQLLSYMQQKIVMNPQAFQQELKQWVVHWETAKHTDDRTIGIIDIKKAEKEHDGKASDR